MSNNHVNPIIAQALQPFAPPKPPRVYAVNICGLETNILAPSGWSAISRVIELQFTDDDECPAEGLTITCKPAAQS